MGVDLILLPMDGDFEGLRFSHTMLGLERRSSLWDAVRALNPRPLGEPLSCHLARIPDGSWKDERGYGPLEKDAYGEPLAWLRACELTGLPGIIVDVNGPAWAYLRALPPETRVVLYWH